MADAPRQADGSNRTPPGTETGNSAGQGAGNRNTGQNQMAGTAASPGSTQSSGASSTGRLPVHTDERRVSYPRAGDWSDFDWLETPFRAMRGVFDQMDRFARDLGFPRPWSIAERGEDRMSGLGSSRLWAPAIEVFERNGSLVITADLPGLSKDDVNVEVIDNTVVIEGERQTSARSDQNGIYRSERSYGHFYRRVPLPKGVDADQAKATFRDGVLEISLPAPDKAGAGRRIEIDDGSASTGTGSTTPSGTTQGDTMRGSQAQGDAPSHALRPDSGSGTSPQS